MPKSKFALGKATEYKVASIFLDADCEVYLPAVDDHGVDMLVIPPKNLNDMLSLPPEVAQELYKAGQSGILEVQVKSLSTGGLFAAISCPNPRPNYFYVFYIRSIETYWLIPSLDFVKIASNVARYHHERFDGFGYPQKLKGNDIPFEARVMAVADVYDALVSKRCYKAEMSFDDAYTIIIEGMGTQFDPSLKDCFIACRSKLEEYYGSLKEDEA